MGDDDEGQALDTDRRETEYNGGLAIGGTPPGHEYESEHLSEHHQEYGDPDNPRHQTIASQLAQARRARRGHPPITCPDPRFNTGFRGYYRCPACGGKARIAGQISMAEWATEWGQTTSEWLMEMLTGGAKQASWIIWETLKTVFRLVKHPRAAGRFRIRIERIQHTKIEDDHEKNGGVEPEIAPESEEMEQENEVQGSL